MRFLASFGALAPCWLGILRGLLLPCIVAFPLLAQAAPILLVQPSGSDATTLETFNRLRGELHVHGFPILLVEGANETRAGAADLAALTELHGALAGVRLVRGSKPVSAEIWIADRGTGSTGARTVLTSAEKDAPLLLAIRVVDLLRTNLREPAGHAPATGIQNTSPGPPSPEVASPAGPAPKADHAARPVAPAPGERHGSPPGPSGAQDSRQPAGAAKRPPVSPPVQNATRPAAPPEPASEQPADESAPARETQDTHRAADPPDEAASASPVESPYPISLSGGLVASFDYHLGFGLGPAVSAHFKVSQRVGLALGLIGPVFGQSYEATNVTARVREEMLVLLVTLSVWHHGRIAQNVFVGPGAMHMAVKGEAQQDLVGRGSSTWVGAAQAGMGIAYQVLPRLTLELSASALLLVPQPAIEVAETRHPIGDPQFLSCLALRLGL